MGVNSLPGVATQQCTGQKSNLRPLDHKSNALPLHHRATLLTDTDKQNSTGKYTN